MGKPALATAGLNREAAPDSTRNILSPAPRRPRPAKSRKPSTYSKTTDTRDYQKEDAMRLAEFVARWMDDNRFSIYDVMKECEAQGFVPPIHYTTVWRIRNGNVKDIEGFTLEKLAAGMPGVTLDDLKQVLKTNPEELNARVRPLELPADLWNRLDDAAKAHQRDWQGELHQILLHVFGDAQELDSKRLKKPYK